MPIETWSICLDGKTAGILVPSIPVKRGGVYFYQPSEGLGKVVDEKTLGEGPWASRVARYESYVKVRVLKVVKDPKRHLVMDYSGVTLILERV